jgi:sugar phosphate isomerase/epimerase
LENMPLFDGLSVSLISPQALRDYAVRNELGVTIDTTHYAQISVDLLEAAHVLNGCVRSLHLSDYLPDRTHVFPGEGMLNLGGFLSLVDFSHLDAVTLECSVSTLDKPDRQMSHVEMVGRMKTLKMTIERMLDGR